MLEKAQYKFATKDSEDLYLDIYYAAPGSKTHIDGKQKPTILFAFPGGFFMGSKSEDYLLPFYNAVVERGYNLVTFDYRLGLKGVEKIEFNLKFQKTMANAVGIAVEDLFSATKWLMDNEEKTGIDTSNLVICGSSAGAITVLQAEWEICNRTLRTSVLPAGFNYAGVVSFSGAIFSTVGPVRYSSEPCPTLLFHGTKDRIVDYRKIAFLNVSFEGSSVLGKKYARKGYNYCFLRFKGNSHEISNSMTINIPYIEKFIEENVIGGVRKITDAVIEDPRITTPDWAVGNFLKLFNNRKDDLGQW